MIGKLPSGAAKDGRELFADIPNTQLFDQSTVFSDIFLGQVIQQSFTLTYQRQKRAAARVVFAVFFEVFRQQFNAFGE